MKKLIAIALLLLVCTACTAQPGGEAGTTTTAAETTTAPDTTAETTAKKEGAEGRSFQIAYPVLKNESCSVNALLQKAATEYPALYFDIPRSADYPELQSVEIDYEVKLADERFISVVFCGLAMREMRPHDLFYAVTIDKKTEKPLEIEEAVNQNADFWRIVLTAAEAELDPLIYQAISRTVAEHGKIGVEFYFTETALGLSFPLVYALGYHAELELPFEKLAGLMKLEG